MPYYYIKYYLHTYNMYGFVHTSAIVILDRREMPSEPCTVSLESTSCDLEINHHTKRSMCMMGLTSMIIVDGRRKLTTLGVFSRYERT